MTRIVQLPELPKHPCKPCEKYEVTCFKYRHARKCCEVKKKYNVALRHYAATCPEWASSLANDEGYCTATNPRRGVAND